MPGFPRAALLVSVLAGGALASPASAETIVTQCGSPISTIVRTDTGDPSLDSSTFKQIPGASVVVTVPAGRVQCLLVLFTSIDECDGQCFVRAIENGAEMDPQDSLHSYSHFEDFPEAHAFSWVRRVGAGQHTIVIQRRSTGGPFQTHQWTMRVDLTN